MGETNPLEILENRVLDKEKEKDVETKEANRLEEFLSDEESEESEDSYDSNDKKRKKRGYKETSKAKTDQFGRRVRYLEEKKKKEEKEFKNKLKSNKKYEMYKIRKLEYEKDKSKRETEGDELSEYQLSAIDRMTFRREQLLKKHSEKFINDLKKNKDN